MAKKLKVGSISVVDIFILNIACQKADYWMAFKINEILPFKLKRADDLEVYLSSEDLVLNYPLFYDQPLDNHKTYYLISNQNPLGKLFPLQKTSDYFFLVNGWISETEKQSISKGIKKIPYVLTAYQQKAETFKNIEDFISNLELRVMRQK
jgi:hypothetical protein